MILVRPTAYTHTRTHTVFNGLKKPKFVTLEKTYAVHFQQYYLHSSDYSVQTEVVVSSYVDMASLH